MKIVADVETNVWLSSLPAGSEAFDWDDSNKYKNLKHAVSWEDVESVLRGGAWLWGRVVGRHYTEERHVLIGVDRRGRTLTLIFTRRGEKLRPISCRPSDRQERRLYEENAI